MPDGGDRFQFDACVGEHLEGQGQTGTVVVDVLDSLDTLATVVEFDSAVGFTDALHEPAGHGLPRAGVDQLELDRGRTGVDDEDAHLPS